MFNLSPPVRAHSDCSAVGDPRERRQRNTMRRAARALLQALKQHLETDRESNPNGPRARTGSHPARTRRAEALFCTEIDEEPGL
jgi:hypothetical protein